MNNESNNNIAVDVAVLENYRLHAKQLSIPILNGFKTEQTDNQQVVFIASAEAFTEQVVSDGSLKMGETFEDRINLVIRNTINYMKYQNMEEPDKNVFFYKDYKNEVFSFKIYVLDFILMINNEKKVIRQFNAYFLEPKFNDFYQVTLSVGPMPIPTKMLKTGTVDLVNDQITQVLDNMMSNVLNNFKYR